MKHFAKGRYSFQGLSRDLALGFLFLSLCLGTFSQSNGWSFAEVAPGSVQLMSTTVDFSGCFVNKNGSGSPWFKCEDGNRRNPMPAENVWPLVHKELEFNVTEPGAVYVVFKGHVAENVWYYENPSAVLQKKREGGKEMWDKVWGGPIHGATWHGSKLTGGSKGIPPVGYRRKADGGLELQDAPHVAPGRYRVFVVSAKRDNWNTAEYAFVPSDCSIKVYFVPDHPRTDAGDEPGQGKTHKPTPGILYYEMSNCG